MKKQIFIFIVGVLIGAIITAGVFLILKGNKKGPESRMDRGNMPFMDGNFPGDAEGFSKPNRDNKPNMPGTTNDVDLNSSSEKE